MAYDLVLALSKALDSDFIYALVLLSFLALGLLKLKNRKLLLLAFLLTGLVGLTLKPLAAQPRPCNAGGASLVPCPTDYGLPSMHASSAAVFAIASLGSGLFFFYFPAAVFIAYSRLYLGVHSLDQVAAGVALAIAMHALSLGLLNAYEKLKGKRK